ncbi:hypothetical protein [Nonomuraea africana]|uniref:Uncharacterized protein n=1 Tax=Nonomuraea africana TaxID=46171 RepID=A0ABR9KUC0_9ACTN|nr:hypothetical protein [Nonomuraea africana]MBE1565611.1 hypothetical protein [Nonomuraea africana]
MAAAGFDPSIGKNGLLKMANPMAPYRLLTIALAAGAGSMILLRIYAGVTAPEIPPDQLRKAAEIFRKLADDLDGGAKPEGGIADLADKAAASVWEHNGGAAVDAFKKLYTERIALFPPAFAKDCRVIATGCDAYAALVEEVRKRLAEIDDAIMQVLWVVAFQPLTTALYAVAKAWAALQIARLAKLAQALKSLFALKAVQILRMAFPTYLLTTINYALIDGAAYAAGSVTASATSKAAWGVPVGGVKENAEDFGVIVGANTGYIVGYDLAKLGLPGPASRGSELTARLMGSAYGYTPTENVIKGEEELAATPEQWASKLEGHGLRALIFPPGWRFVR